MCAEAAGPLADDKPGVGAAGPVSGDTWSSWLFAAGRQPSPAGGQMQWPAGWPQLDQADAVASGWMSWPAGGASPQVMCTDGQQA